MAITPERVGQIEDEQSLYTFLASELEWPIQSVPDTFEFFPDELGLTEAETQQIRAVRQIANFEKGQPWGIFLVEFAGGRLYQTALRRVLRGLSESRRARVAGLPRVESRRPPFYLHAELPRLHLRPLQGTNAHTSDAGALRLEPRRHRAADALHRKPRQARLSHQSPGNLYGVDKDEFAVNTARLRLWLSLVVDDTRNPLDDPNADVALPNLDFKIEFRPTFALDNRGAYLGNTAYFMPIQSDILYVLGSPRTR